MVERRREWRAGSRFLAVFGVESVFLQVRKYIALVPRRPSRTKMASLHAQCSRGLLLQAFLFALHFNNATSSQERNASLPRQSVVLQPRYGERPQAYEL